MNIVDYIEQSNWLLPLLFLAVAADGVFPPLPSELLVLSVVAVAAATGNPPMWHLLLAAGLGALVGDHLAYGVGNRLATRTRGPVRAGLARAAVPIERHGATALMVGRFLPAGRVAVNAAAGATGFPYRTYVAVTLATSTAWAGYCGLVGTVSARWADGNPLTATLIAAGTALALGAVVDVVRRRTAVVSDDLPKSSLKSRNR
ncbi:DedA family protein [Rhodococcus triatomae]|uniref:Membrane protein DedA, SNARE-associated domain n=1 Tax=Rhodococcus triatomae TaxID=300028 RepID=A0A1G8KYT2_9NOCA|nr:VTT domain-containing protein [Rhodococcus triatomae]QNG20463.1 DedA family protein [Rhodococcus triatomae]QNG23620.1 DedA family protein [Rhodococcus triatomae]SDI48507.1 membrane protein DedA, SNARE-associated domain [Rhodococcus triatomae]